MVREAVSGSMVPWGASVRGGADLFEVTVEKLVYGGDGLARLDGRVVLAPFVLPGERVRVDPIDEKPRLIRARTIDVLEPAAERVTAPCPYFARCGGCHYQQAQYEYQLAAKRAILVEELRRLGKVEPPEEISLVAAEPWGYRNRTQVHIVGGRIGYWEARSHRLCAIEQCPISSPKINEVLRDLQEMVRDRRWPRFLRSLEIFTDEQQVQLNVVETEQPVARRFFDWCAERIAGFVEGPLDYLGKFRVAGKSFFQINRFLLDGLVDAAVDGASGESALDLYAGVGLFSLALAKNFQEVTGVESGNAAVRDLLFNAERAGLANVKAEATTVEEYLRGLTRAPDFVLLDPPRAGLGRSVIERLLELRPKQMVIVACDPATLARDLSGLTAGEYRIDSLKIVDLFPQTYHLETVAHLSATR
jgi:23S rRNA (uracil1939-C5)-methyltransferase